MKNVRILNVELAEAKVAQISDEVIRNLVRLAVTEVCRSFVKWDHQSDADWKSILPTSDFDLAFFVHVMTGLFSRRSLVEATLAGEDPVEASGWAIDWDE